MKETIEKLMGEINSNIGQMSSIAADTEEYTTAVNNTVKLIDKATELSRIESEERIRQEEIARKEQIRQDEKKSETRNFALECVKVGVPVLTTAAVVLHDDRMAKMLLKFEEVGTLTTTCGRNFFSKLFKRK